MEVFEKSQTVDPEVRAYVYSLVNAVGGQSTVDSCYAIGDDAVAVLNDLRRWIRLYDEKLDRFDVKRCLAEANLVKGDLLEILALWPEQQQENKLKAKLALLCLQLLVPLTWPIELDEDKTTVNHLRHKPYLSLAQVGYKRAVLQYEDAPMLRTVVRIGLPYMVQERRERSRREEGIIKMMLYFLRNMAMISQPQDLPSQGDENDIGRSSTIEEFHKQEVFNLLLTVASGANDEFIEQDVIVLETLFHLVKGVDPRKLFLQRSQLAQQESNELQNLIKKEKAMLNGYNKHAPTRHNRFGTMLWVKRDDDKMSTVTGQNTITNDSATLMQMDQSKHWNRPKQRGKKNGDDYNENEKFSARVELTEKARTQLRDFVEDFLDSGFNPLFSSLRKAIQREADRVGSSIAREYFYLISWFLSAEAARRAQRGALQPDTAGENSYAYIAAVLDQDTLVLLNSHMQRNFDEKNWQDLQATLLCFTQILLTVQNMAESQDEEDQEIAENIQNRIFYEESTQDRIVQILRTYHNQGLSYLDTVTDCVHVFVRMLERYSKVNVDLQVRSKRRARRKKKQKQQRENQSGTNDNENNEEDAGEYDAEDQYEAQLVATERKFDFNRFSAKFMTQPCVDTFVSLLHYYADLNADQLKRCHRYLYRLAFKNDLSVLVFRVDVLALLHKMIKGPNGLSAELDGYEEWEQLIQQVFRKCIKWIERENEGEGWKEAVVTEMLFSKNPGTTFYLQNGFERVVEKAAPRPPAQLELKRSVTEDQKVGTVVCVMLELGKGEELGWVKKEFQRALQERQAWEDEREARASTENANGNEETTGTEGAASGAPTIFLSPDTDERKLALFKDKYLRLLLTTAGAERLGTAEDTEASWILPSELSAETLKEILSQIEKTEFDPPSFEEGKTAQDLIRNKSSSQREETAESESESGSDREIFPSNLREKRKPDDDGDQGRKKKRRLTRRNRTELTEEQAQAKAEQRRKKERERNGRIKSQLFVTASDDESDEEGDAEFFRLEEAQRKKMSGFIQKALLEEGADGGKKKTKSKGKKKTQAESEDQGSEVDMDSDAEATDENITQPRQPATRIELSSNEDSDIDSAPADDADSLTDLNAAKDASEQESTPSTSPLKDLPLGEVSGNVAGSGTGALAKHVDSHMDGDDEDEEPVLRPAARRRVRAGFVVESDSDE